MALMPREAVVRVLQTLLANTEADASRSSASRDWFDGRASGIKSALNVLTADEDELLPPVGEGTRKYSLDHTRGREMKPTLGPWEIDDDSQRIDGIGTVRMYRVVAPDGAVVAEFSNADCSEIVYEDDGDGLGVHYDYQAMANAQLIAAAPDMADAIAALLETYEPYPGGDAWDAYQAAKAALAKASGEQHS